MAVRDGARFLAAAIESVLDQPGAPDREILVVDGGSTDGSEGIARSYDAVRWIVQDGHGFAAAWNTGVAAARGDLIAFLDSDDRWTPNKLAGQTRLLRTRPELQGAIGRVRFVLEPGVPPPPGFRPDLFETDHLAPMPGTLLARRSLFEAIGPFPADMSIASDIEWFARLKDSDQLIGTLEEVVLIKRIHDRNLSVVAAGGLRGELLGVLRRSVERQRTPRAVDRIVGPNAAEAAAGRRAPRRQRET